MTRLLRLTARCRWRSPAGLFQAQPSTRAPARAQAYRTPGPPPHARPRSAKKTAITTGIDAVRALIDARHRPHGCDVGFNDGAAAGQTVMHFHLRVIPRYDGDVSDPRGGVRWVLRDKAAYWQSTDP